MIKTNNKKCLIILLTSLIINRYKYIFDNNCYVYFLDVKQGDSAILISEHHQEVIMIDTGGKLEYEIETWQKKKTYQISTNTITFLKSIGINKIDTLLLSHGDEDHAGETINIVNNMKVKNVIFNNNDYNNLEKNIINVLNKKNINYYKNVKHMDFSNTRIQFLNTGLFNDENEDSNVISLNLYNNIFLFMGDAGVKKENEIMSNYELGSIDVLKVGHHGSSTSTSLDFIKTIKPKYSIISAGKNNRYGHPKESVLDTLSLSKIYRTDLNGSIMMKLSKNGLIINKFNP